MNKLRVSHEERQPPVRIKSIWISYLFVAFNDGAKEDHSAHVHVQAI